MIDLADDGGEYRLIGRVVNVIADESVLTENGKVDLGKLQAISYDSALHAYRVIGEVVGAAFHDGLSLK